MSLRTRVLMTMYLDISGRRIWCIRLRWPSWRDCVRLTLHGWMECLLMYAVRTIVSTQYLHHHKPDLATRNALNEQLCLWESQLPVELRWGSVFIDPVSLFLKGLLHMTYQCVSQIPKIGAAIDSVW